MTKFWIFPAPIVSKSDMVQNSTCTQEDTVFDCKGSVDHYSHSITLITHSDVPSPVNSNQVCPVQSRDEELGSSHLLKILFRVFNGYAADWSHIWVYSSHPYKKNYQGTSKVWYSIFSVLQAHKMIRNSGIPNLLGLHIPVKTNFKVSSWRKHLCDYCDKQ